VQAKDINDFLRSLYSTTTDQFKQMTGDFVAAAENTAKGNSERM
jgi:hypothetical protein